MTKEDKPPPPTIEDLERMDAAPWKTAPTVLGSVNPISLYTELRLFFKTYLVFQDERLYDVVTAWTLSTWHIGRYNRHGPLIAIGLIETGKTTLLECEEEVAYRGVRGGSMSNSVMFRLSHAFTPTLLIDESQIFNREEYAEAKAFLNERYKRGAKVWRMNLETMVPESFNAFGPTVLAQSDQSWDAMTSRGVILKMAKGTPKEETLTERFYHWGRDLRGQLKLYSTIEGQFSDPTLELAKLQSPRLREIGLPLLSESYDGEPRDAILSYLVDLEESRNATLNTGYESDIFRAFLMVGAIDKVSMTSIRDGLMTMWDIDKKNDKRLPHPKTLMKVMLTMGFNPTRTSDNKAAVFYNPKLVEQLSLRFGISSGSSISSGPSVKEPGANGATGANLGIDPSDPKRTGKDDELVHCKPCNTNMTGREYRAHVCQGTFDSLSEYA